MKVVSSHTYAASPEQVFAVMTTPDVLVDKYRALGHKDVTILEHQETESLVTVHSRRGVPMDVPGFAKKVLKPVNTVEQRDLWNAAGPDGARNGTWEVTARGVPVKVGGTLKLVPVPGGTRVDITGDVSCSLPLVGGKIASLVGADVERTMHGEEEFNDARLRGG